MPTYIIEREIPGAGKLTDDELRGITQKSNEVVDELERPYTWRHSYVAGDKIYCVHEADSAEVVREHSRRGQFPANLVAEVAAVFDSTGPPRTARLTGERARPSGRAQRRRSAPPGAAGS